jgi:protein-S-isoprenylcysteine O-methyltransferase Ste14
MTRAQAAIGTAVFFVLAPGIVGGLIPWLITGWQLPADYPLFRIPLFIGAMLVLGGLWVLIDSFVQFARSLGTPAPLAPTQRLVVESWYRHVRNPMYVAVLAIIVGQALIFWNIWLMAYAALAFLAVHLFVVGYEEPTLRRRFPADYATYAANVPRWRPRLRPWRRGQAN